MKSIVDNQRNWDLIASVLKDSGRLRAINDSFQKRSGDPFNRHWNLITQSDLARFFSEDEVSSIASVRNSICLPDRPVPSFHGLLCALMAQIINGSTRNGTEEITLHNGRLAKAFMRFYADFDEAIALEKAIFEEILERFRKQLKEQQLTSAS